MATKTNKIPENKLLKALAELEDVIEKGASLEDADPEGGLSTEGTPLSRKAPSGRGEAKKSRHSSFEDESSVSKAEDDESESDDDDDDDDDSDISNMLSASDAAPPFKKKGAPAKDDDSDDDDRGDDNDSDDDTEKSFREVAEGDETMAKAIEVSDFIEAMVDQLSGAMGQMAKALRRIEERLGARIDHRVAKSLASQQNFNARLAQAVSAIGNSVQDDLVDVVKSLANSPVSPRGKALLSKGEVNQPPWSGSQSNASMADGSDGGGDYLAEVNDLSPEVVGEWLFKKSMTNQIDSKLIMAWEADRYNVEVLPVQVRKALVNDLCK